MLENPVALPKGEKCPTGNALLTRFTEEKREHRENPPIAARRCIHVSLPDYSTTSFENKAQVLSKDVAARQAIRDGSGLLRKPK